MGRIGARLEGVGQVILVVEDDADLRENLDGVLSTAGYRVITIACGRDALAALDGCHVDLLVADWGLPDMSGAELVSKARAMCPGVFPVLMMTGWQPQDLGPMEVNAWLRKPFDREALLAMVETLLR